MPACSLGVWPEVWAPRELPGVLGAEGHIHVPSVLRARTRARLHAGWTGAELGAQHHWTSPPCPKPSGTPTYSTIPHPGTGAAPSGISRVPPAQPRCAGAASSCALVLRGCPSLVLYDAGGLSPSRPPTGPQNLRRSGGSLGAPRRGLASSSSSFGGCSLEPSSKMGNLVLK